MATTACAANAETVAHGQRISGAVMHEVEALLREYDRARAYTDELWKDLGPDEVTWRPHENFSAIGWHLGHQAHVAHFMVRNLTAAEPSPDPALDALLDSALPEQFRGALPTVRRLALCGGGSGWECRRVAGRYCLGVRRRAVAW